MTAALFPAYGLARLFVPRVAACVVAASRPPRSPALAYAGMLIPESLAYFWSTLALCLVARALVRPARTTAALAVGALVVAPLVRSELAVLIARSGARRGSSRRRVRARAAADRLRGPGASGSGGDADRARPRLARRRSSHTTPTSWQIGTALPPPAVHLRPLGGRRVHDRRRRPAGARRACLGARRALPDARRDASCSACSSASTVVLRSLHRGQGVVPLDDLRDPRRGAEPDLPRPARLRRRGALVHAAGGSGSSRRALATAAIGYLIATTPYHDYEHLYSDAFGLAILAVAEPHRGTSRTPTLQRLLFGILGSGRRRARVDLCAGGRPAAAAGSRRSPSAARSLALAIVAGT